VEDIRVFKNRNYPTKVTMVDKLRGDTGTVMTIKKIDFDIPIPDEMVSERELLKK